MARRKGWDELSPQYRRRLERAGVDRAAHEGGASLHKARGHLYDRMLHEYARDVERYYNIPRSQVIAEIRGDVSSGEYSWRDIAQAIELQHQMQELYEQGRIDEARALWEMRDVELPEWLFFYHGVFG